MSETPIDEDSFNDSDKSSRRKKLLFEASGEKRPKMVLNETTADNESKSKEISTMNVTVDCSSANRGNQVMSMIGNEAVATRYS